MAENADLTTPSENRFLSRIKNLLSSKKTVTEAQSLTELAHPNMDPLAVTAQRLDQVEAGFRSGTGDNTASGVLKPPSQDILPNRPETPAAAPLPFDPVVPERPPVAVEPQPTVPAASKPPEFSDQFLKDISKLVENPTPPAPPPEKKADTTVPLTADLLKKEEPPVDKEATEPTLPISDEQVKETPTEDDLQKNAADLQRKMGEYFANSSLSLKDKLSMYAQLSLIIANATAEAVNADAPTK